MMEINNETVTHMVACMERTLSPREDERKPAEQYLQSIEGNQNYPILLLVLIQADGTQAAAEQAKMGITLTVPPLARQAAAIVFKNFVKRNWSQEEKISEHDRQLIKEKIIALMLRSSDAIQRQLSEACSIIGREDFPAKWPNLLDEMVGYMNSSRGEFQIINGVLSTAESLFARYRHEFRSDDLWREIKYVLERFAQPFTELFQALVNYSKTTPQGSGGDSKQMIKFIFSSLVSCSKIYHYLTYQDLPEYFEDHLKEWMSNYLDLLGMTPQSNAGIQLLEQDASDEEPSVIETLKSEICETIAMFAQKYDTDFEPFVAGFVQAVWSLLIATPTTARYDLLVSGAINFISTVAFRPQYSQLFQEAQVLDSLCSKVIIPNMEFRDTDEELFEDNAEEFIRRDIEGSDADTRRRAACDLVRALSRNFEARITQVFSQYIQEMLVRFQANPDKEWRAKDAAIFLVTSMAAKTSSTRFGISSTSQLVNLVEFFTGHVRGDLERGPDMSKLPVLRADALKYFVTFRNQFPVNEVLLPSLGFVVRHLTAPSVVVHTYAAHALERVMMMRDPTNQNVPLLKPERDFAGEQGVCLLRNCFIALSIEGSHENEYVMKAIMRTFSLMQAQVLPLLGEIMPHLMACITRVCKNPTKPHFNHYLFETVALAIGISFKSTDGQSVDVQLASIAQFEAALFPLFQNILQQSVTDFMPYVFQLLAFMLECRTSAARATRSEGTVPDPYMQLLPFLIMPALWETSSNHAPLSRLLIAYINLNANQVVGTPKMLEGILGVFQKLISSKLSDHHGFMLLNNILFACSPESLQQYQQQIFNILFRRLSHQKTPKYVGCIIEFLSLFAVQRGPATLVGLIEALQAKMFGMVLERLYILEVQKVDGAIERRHCAAGMVKILTETPEMSEGVGPYAAVWPRLLETCVTFLEKTNEMLVTDGGHFAEVEDNINLSGSGAVSLTFAKRPVFNPLADQLPSDMRQLLAHSLGKLASSRPGKVPLMISAIASGEVKNKLGEYLTASGVNLV